MRSESHTKQRILFNKTAREWIRFFNVSGRVQCSLIVLAAFIGTIFFPQTTEAARYAVLVGCSQGDSTVTPLKYAESDACQFADIVQKFGSFAPANVRVVTGADSSKMELQLVAVDSLIHADKGPNSLFLFYFSGHADGTRLMFGNHSYALAKIQAYLDTVPSAIKIGVFDACNSGAVTILKGGVRAEPFFYEAEQTVHGQIIIASSSANERAQESETLKGSIFSHHWFNALRGSADATGDHKITVDEAYKYAYRKTVETTALATGEIQHPAYRFNVSGEGEVVLTVLEKVKGGILFDKSCAGKYLVLSDDYLDVFADFSKKKGVETFIALNPGTYSIINALDRNIGTSTIKVKKDATSRMRQKLLVPNLLGIKK